MKETITEQILSKQLDYLLEIKDFKETNKQLDSALVKAYNDIKSLRAQLDAHLEKQLDMPTEEDVANLELDLDIMTKKYDEVYNSVEMHVDKEIDKDELIEVLKNTLGL
tara:strand:- start:45 stop:371 length:327 start_codon:yes stop_codon:yes gene_type:complete